MNAPMPAEACTEVGHDDTPQRAHDWRLLIVLCLASWILPAATLVIISMVTQ